MGRGSAATALVVVGAIAVAAIVGRPAEAGQERIQHGSVSVSKSGSGTGRVVSRPALYEFEQAIDCGSVCSGSFIQTGDPRGYTPVTLTATPDPGSTFDGWGGACSGSGGCTIDPVEELVSYGVTATFTLIPASSYPVGVARTGQGTVTSAPGGIDCGSSCSASFATGSGVTLTATPAAGWTFGGWSGACSGTGGCSFTVDGPKSVTATFSPPPPQRHELRVARAGNGRVTSSPGGIDCGGACSAAYDSGTQVTLTAAADPGAGFVGWGGACSGASPTCVVTVDGDRAVTASFGGATSQPLAVSVAGRGSVTSTPAGITCGAACTASFRIGAVVSLTALPADGWVFTGWSGGCTGADRVCSVTLSEPRIVPATFAEAPAALPLVVTTSGRGTVRSTPAGILCGATCTAAMAPGAGVTLVATPAKGWVLVRWLGSCTGVKTSCRVVMDGPRTTTAQFARAADRVAPKVRALASVGKRGTRLRLRYRVTDASRRTREWAVIRKGKKKVGAVRRKLHAHDQDALYYTLSWRAPRKLTAGSYRFCVRSADATGNVAKWSCATVRVTG